MPLSEREEVQLKRCLFVGPSVREIAVNPAVRRFGPAQLGSIYLAARAGYKIIGLIDGVFGDVPTVWHKEILFALDQGCAVCGSSSIGALRAAELHAYGMRGIGLCYRLYRAGVITDDDEVAVLHSDETANYLPLSEPLVNARLTLHDMRRHGFVSAGLAGEIIKQFKAVHFSQRTFPEFRRILICSFGEVEGQRVYELFRLHYRDVKREDGTQLIHHVMTCPVAEKKTHFFLRTGHWRHQFEELESELKPLQ